MPYPRRRRERTSHTQKSPLRRTHRPRRARRGAATAHSVLTPPMPTASTHSYPHTTPQRAAGLHILSGHNAHRTNPNRLTAKPGAAVTPNHPQNLWALRPLPRTPPTTPPRKHPTRNSPPHTANATPTAAELAIKCIPHALRKTHGTHFTHKARITHFNPPHTSHSGCQRNQAPHALLFKAVTFSSFLYLLP